MNKEILIKNLKGLTFGIVYGLIARGIIELEFNSDINSTSGLMTLTFLFIVPFVIGIITTYQNRNIKNALHALILSMPLFSILGLILITVILQWEGIICALMAIPIFAIMALIGGFIGIKAFKRDYNNLKISVLVLLPFILAPIEKQIGLSEKVFQEKTSIIVNGSDTDIWENITRVHYIDEKENQNSLFQRMGFPRPLEATLDTVAIGGIRIAKFDRGLFFTETVTKLENKKLLKFSIFADPKSIPPKALDEHVLVGGNYFDVLNGCYEIKLLEKPNTYRIDLTSEFRLSTNFNFYSGFWSKLIMRDIQENILKVLKIRVEKNNENKG
jgi:hypothetical protein